MVNLSQLYEQQLLQMNNQEGKTGEDRPALFVHKNMAINSEWSDKDIVMAGYAGLEGSVMLAQAKKSELLAYYSESFIASAIDQEVLLKKLKESLPEAATAVMSDECGLYELSRSGIFAGLWNMAYTTSVGLEVDLKKIPIKQETIEICNYLDVNPYQLLSGGAMLFITDNGFRLIQELARLDIPARMIGITQHSYDRVVTNNGEKRYLEKHYEDPVVQLLGELQTQ